MSIFRFEPDSEFFGHIVTHDTQDQPGQLPRVLHVAHCQACDEEITLHGDTPADIDQAFKNALFTHHIQVLAARLKSTERAARYPEGSELLGGG